jgi:hypothetical protein
MLNARKTTVWKNRETQEEKEVPGAKPVRVDIPVHVPHGWQMDIRGGVADPGHLLFAASDSMLSASSYDDGEVEGLFWTDERYDQVDASWHSGSHVSSSSVAPRLLTEVTTFFSDISKNPFGNDQQSRWESILSELERETGQGFDLWSESQKAELYLTLANLRAYGFSAFMPDAIRERPFNDVDAMPTWIAAQRALGIQVNL